MVKVKIQMQSAILVSFVSIFQVIFCDVGRFDYMVDCSACYAVPIQNIDSYSCKVRCQVGGEYQK